MDDAIYVRFTRKWKEIQTLNITNQYNCKCLEIAISYTLPSRKVIENLQRTIDEYGKSLGIRIDNGPEFTSSIFQSWLDKNDIEWIKIQKRKPQQKMQSLNDSTEPIAKTFLMQT